MSIKPIDFQVMLPKTSEVSKQQNEMQHRGQIAQQQQMSSTQHSVDHILTQVYSQDKAKGGTVKEKQDNNKGQKKEEKKKRSGYNNKKRREEDPVQTSTIDIRL
jgi:hypothetical protein